VRHFLTSLRLCLCAQLTNLFRSDEEDEVEPSFESIGRQPTSAELAHLVKCTFSGVLVTPSILTHDLQRKIGLIVDSKFATESYSPDCVAAMKADSNAHFVTSSIIDLLNHNRDEDVYARMFEMGTGNFHFLFCLAVFNLELQCYFPSVTNLDGRH
jgi:hypothetical protein